MEVETSGEASLPEKKAARVLQRFFLLHLSERVFHGAFRTLGWIVRKHNGAMYALSCAPHAIITVIESSYAAARNAARVTSELIRGEGAGLGGRLSRDAVPFVDPPAGRASSLWLGGSRSLFRTPVMRAILPETKHLNMSRESFEDTKEDPSWSPAGDSEGSGHAVRTDAFVSRRNSLERVPLAPVATLRSDNSSRAEFRRIRGIQLD